MTSSFQPTHEVTWGPKRFFAMLADPDADGHGALYTRDEWELRASADWELTAQGLLRMGKVPHGESSFRKLTPDEHAIEHEEALSHARTVLGAHHTRELQKRCDFSEVTTEFLRVLHQGALPEIWRAAIRVLNAEIALLSDCPNMAKLTRRLNIPDCYDALGTSDKNPCAARDTSPDSECMTKCSLRKYP